MSFDDFSAEQRAWQERASKAQAAAAQAYNRLLKLAEERDSGQIRIIASFLACTYNSRLCSFDFFDLRALDVAISDDMLVCLDALRWGRADLYTLVPDGDRRMRQMLMRWDLAGATDSP